MPTDAPTYAGPADKLRNVERISRLLDSKFRIPGTNIRFGADFLVGLVPYGGDLLSFLMSGALVITMARHGASGGLVARMLLNVFIDTVVGAVPILGDIFDLFFKSNRRNYELLREHYEEGAHSGSAKGIIIGTVIALLVMLVLLFGLVFWLVSVTWNWLVG